MEIEPKTTRFYNLNIDKQKTTQIYTCLGWHCTRECDRVRPSKFCDRTSHQFLLCFNVPYARRTEKTVSPFRQQCEPAHRGRGAGNNRLRNDSFRDERRDNRRVQGNSDLGVQIMSSIGIRDNLGGIRLEFP
ncbi:hypothetical protein EVAR_63133_1 [Eumeta japonica]|uniref:Uncharacterized protein n=1 Tax=Eumeta variegata TaxID=151549 RepID=A0A4C2A9U9_EUMVA|nr:hypothetical protein EVAR_63133_1 [Eumeta japonica]